MEVPSDCCYDKIRSRYIKGHWYFSSLGSDRLLHIKVTVFNLAKMISLKVVQKVSFLSASFAPELRPTWV